MNPAVNKAVIFSLKAFNKKKKKFLQKVIFLLCWIKQFHIRDSIAPPTVMATRMDGWQMDDGWMEFDPLPFPRL